MKSLKKEISKEVYERSLPFNGVMAGEDRVKCFDIQTISGYGLYGVYCYEDNGKYYCNYYVGDSCD